MTDVSSSESPRWLVEHGQTAKARKSMLWLRSDTDQANIELAMIEATFEREKSEKNSLAMWDMFRNPIDRRRTIIAVAAVNTQAASGAMFIIGKSPNGLYQHRES